MKHYLLQDLETAKVDAIIVTNATKEEVESSIAKAKEKEDYTWEDLLECMPKDTQVIDCFSGENRIYY